MNSQCMQSVLIIQLLNLLFSQFHVLADDCEQLCGLKCGLLQTCSVDLLTCYCETNSELNSKIHPIEL